MDLAGITPQTHASRLTTQPGIAAGLSAFRQMGKGATSERCTQTELQTKCTLVWGKCNTGESRSSKASSYKTG